MSKEFRIDLGSVDYGSLKTEADYERKADSLLPNSLVKFGEGLAEVAWDEMQKGFKRTGLSMNQSSSERRKFIRDGGQDYRRTANTKDKQKLKKMIIDELRKQKLTVS